MSDQFLADLRGEVAAAARHLDEGPAGHRSPDRRGRWLLSAAAAVLLVVVVAAAFLVGGRPTTPAVQVERDGDTWRFSWDEGAPDSDEIRRLGDELGLDLDVAELPTGADGVGTVSGYSSDGAYIAQFGTGQDGSERSFRIPVDYTGRVVVNIGRLAREGEPWDFSVPATDPHGPLACQPLLGEPLARTIEALEGTSLRVEGLADSASSDAPLRDLSLDDLRTHADRTVLRLDLSGPDELWIHIGGPDDLDDVRQPDGC